MNHLLVRINFVRSDGHTPARLIGHRSYSFLHLFGKRTVIIVTPLKLHTLNLHKRTAQWKCSPCHWPSLVFHSPLRVSFLSQEHSFGVGFQVGSDLPRRAARGEPLDTPDVIVFLLFSASLPSQRTNSDVATTVSTPRGSSLKLCAKQVQRDFQATF